MSYASRIHAGKILSKVCGLLLGATLGLTGCAVAVKKSNTDVPLKINKESRKQITMNVTGSREATTSKDWELISNAWRDAMAGAAESINSTFSMQVGKPRPTGQTGTLLVVNIEHFRYLSEATRYLTGILGGNAYVEASVQFKDSRTGTPFGKQTFNTSSTAWEGIFSAMTDKQIKAIATEIASEINNSGDAPPSSGVAAVDDGLEAASTSTAIVSDHWNGIMSCAARTDITPNRPAYNAKFSMELNGNSATVHRRNALVDETLTGYIAGNRLELHGNGYRVENPGLKRQFTIAGAMQDSVGAYSGTGSMLVNNKAVRACELTMVRGSGTRQPPGPIAANTLPGSPTKSQADFSSNDTLDNDEEASFNAP